MGDADPLLVHGVAWASATPQLEVSSFTDDAPHPIPLLGRRLAFSVDPARYCLGFREHTDAGSRHRLCDGSRLATTGHQCERCAARDTSRFMHHAHRGGYVPDTMNVALAQPHWLYIATFADGTSKVGTATDARKRIRLDEQGAVRATYLTRAADGYAVRHLGRRHGRSRHRADQAQERQARRARPGLAPRRGCAPSHRDGPVGS